MQVTPDDAEPRKRVLELSGGVRRCRKCRGGTPIGERAPLSARPHPLMRRLDYAPVGVPLPFVF